MRSYDVIVLGLGAMGAAAAYQLARRGAKVLGLDQFSPPHRHGSSHGETRVTRLAIGEGAHYTPLVMRSHEIWRAIEQETGAKLLTVNGCLIVSSNAPRAVTHVEDFFQNTVAAAKSHGIAHEILNTAEIRKRFPQFNVCDNEIGYFERDAGFLRPEECIRAQLALAAKNGAALHTNEAVLEFEPALDHVTVKTGRAAYTAEKLIVAAGAWLPRLLGPRYAALFKVLRQVQFWFAPEGDVAPFLPERMPVFIWELQGRPQGIYGFPALDAASGVKIATEQYESATTPQTADRNVSGKEIASMYESYVAPYLRDVSARCVGTAPCLYTSTPDAGFVIDRHPDSDRVLIASACSGHGFKHSPAIGEALCELAFAGKSHFDLGAFGLSRFAALR